jgi:hypothetical protein
VAGRSIHDNRVVSYEVDGERRRIVLHTRSGGELPPFEFTDLIFEGVFAYHLEHDNFGNILFGVEELPVAQLVSQEQRLFEAGSKWGWPGPWNVSPEASIDYLVSKRARAFEISSSYGLAGWVIAEGCRLDSASPTRAV